MAVDMMPTVFLCAKLERKVTHIRDHRTALQHFILNQDEQRGDYQIKGYFDYVVPSLSG